VVGGLVALLLLTIIASPSSSSGSIILSDAQTLPLWPAALPSCRL
jgi:hypothetical protein